MKSLFDVSLKMLRHCQIVVFALLISASSAASAQAVLAGAQTGTLQLMRQDDGYITISGRNYNFDNEVSRVYLAGERVDSAILDEGMVVRFTLNGQGILERIEIIGPAAKLREIEEH